MTHHIHRAVSEFFETPEGVLGERYVCSCGATSTAAQMAETPGGCVANALFGQRPCVGIIALHNHGDDEIEVVG
jgi:hypothetical protein